MLSSSIHKYFHSFGGRLFLHLLFWLAVAAFFGMLALVTGIFGQMIGLYEAMKHISQIGEVSQAVLAGGLRVSSITSLYGFIVFILAHLIWFLLNINGRFLTES